jgi:beta-lactamase regulating signal transducer with metallopeptidase domain
MTLQYFVSILIQTTIIGGIALALALLAKRSPAATVAICRTGILALAVWVSVSLFVKQTPNPVIRLDVPPTVRFGSGVLLAHKVVGDNQPQTTPLPSQVAPNQTSAPSYDLAQLIAAIWLTGSSLLLIRSIFGALMLARFRRSGKEAGSGVLTLSAKVAKEAGIRNLGIAVHPRLSSPCVFGVLRPTILLPESWLASADDLAVESVLRHECAHIELGDLLWKSLYTLISACLWPQPLVWLLGKPMSGACEELCDAKVVGAGCSPTLYANVLIDIRESSPRSVYGIAAVAKRSDLSKRVEAILSGALRAAKVGPLARAGIVAALVLGAAGSYKLLAVAHIAPSAQAAKSEVTVQIVSDNGEPVRDLKAWLVVSRPDATWSVLPVDPIDGSVRVDFDKLQPMNSAILAAEAPGYGLSFSNLGAGSSSGRTLHMLPASTVSGRLILPNGEAGAGLRVRATSLFIAPQKPALPLSHEPRFQFLHLTGSLSDRYSAVTNAKGNFVISGLPQQCKLRIDVDDPRFATVEDQFNIGSDPTSVLDPLPLRPGATFSGVVTRNGQPVSGIPVGAQGARSWGDAKTDATGHFLITRLSAGTYNVALNLPEDQEQRETAIAHEGMAIKPGQSVDDMNFELIGGCVIKGRVTYPDGSGAKATVGIYGPAHPHSGAWVQGVNTDDKGNYLTRVPPGGQFVYLMNPTEAPGPRRLLNSQTVDLKPGQEQIVDFRLTMPSGKDGANKIP